MKRILILLTAVFILLLVFISCAEQNGENGTEDDTEEREEEKVMGYTQITQDEAKRLMDTEENYIILDVRTQEEYDKARIPNSLLIPDYEIEEKSVEYLKDKSQLILVYCRSGNRSKTASQKLADMGYTNVKEFGGITTWQYEIEK